MNGIYTSAKESILNGSINWVNDNIRAVAVNTSNYTVNLSTHQFLSSIPNNARVAVSQLLTSKTATAGVADAADTTFSVVSGSLVSALVLYSDTGADATSRLLYYIDSASAGLPFTPNGGDVVIQWPNSGSRIFAL